jgi:hypothetical protein
VSDAKIPAGWYPDPKDTTTTPRPERWWDGTGWTTTTRTGSGAPQPVQDPDGEPTQVLEGTVLADDGTVRYPEPPTGFTDGTDHPAAGADYPAPGTDYLSGYPEAAPKKPSLLSRIGRKALVAAAVAGVLGLAVGSGATYLAVGRHNQDHQQTAAPAPQNTYPGPGHHRGSGNGGLGGNGGSGQGNGGLGGNGGAGGGQSNGGNGQGNGNGNGGGQGSGGGIPGIPGLGGGMPGLGDGTQAVDIADGISLPIPSGWQGTTTGDGLATMQIGEYTCPGASANNNGNATCTLGGVNTAQVDGTDPKAAAEQDIQKVASASYGPTVKSHQELKSEAVTVAGRSGYLIRWQVVAQQGNNGTVQDVVFPTADGKHLVAVQFGFDIADKAPAVSTMDTIVSGIKDFSGPGLGSSGGSNSPSGGASGGAAGGVNT